MDFVLVAEQRTSSSEGSAVFAQSPLSPCLSRCHVGGVCGNTGHRGHYYEPSGPRICGARAVPIPYSS